MLVWLLCSLGGLVGYFWVLRRAIASLPQFQTNLGVSDQTIGVIVPAYNEADNIAACVASILDSTEMSARQFGLWVVDDRSSDQTWGILQGMALDRQDPRLHLIAGSPRPVGENWQGKNWACVQGVEQAPPRDYLVFIDADVRLCRGAFETLLNTMTQQRVDFLNCIPALVCGSLVEWLVQPLIFMNLLVSLNSDAVRDPRNKTAYAAGPIMAFRRSVYETIGGHRGVGDRVAEDVALARLVKQSGFNSQYWLGAKIARLRMYQNWSALWEGWTKVLYVGADRSMAMMLLLGGLMLLLYSVPGGVAIALLFHASHWTWADLGLFILMLGALGLHYQMRHSIALALDSQTKYWWLQGLGGILVAMMAIASVLKTETGWGWTWRGRQLKE
jgi:glycosyltransferase involved in cell wall biosynthesis